MKQITKLADAVVREAWKYYSAGCAETGKKKNSQEGNNIVACGGKVISFPTLTAGPNSWCAAFVHLIYSEAAKSIGISAEPPLRTADVSEMYSKAKTAKIRIDKNASIGSIILRSTKISPKTTTKLAKGTDKTSHVAIIVGITDDNKWVTIEGNTGDRVDVKYYDKAGALFLKSDHIVLHYEEWKNTPLVEHTLETKILAAAKTSSSNANDDGDHASSNSNNSNSNNSNSNNFIASYRNVWK